MSADASQSGSFEDLQSDLKSALHALAAAQDEDLGNRIEGVGKVLDRYQGFLEGLPDSQEHRDLARRLSASRLELERHRAGEIPRRDAVGRIRLILLRPSAGPSDS